MKTEHEEQVALFEWINTYKAVYPDLNCVYAIPNGGFRHITTAKRLHAEGVKAGVWDIHIPIRAHGSTGLWIEMKVGKNKLTENQKNWARLMVSNYHKTAVCYSWTEAAFMICDYLGLPKNIIPEL